MTQDESQSPIFECEDTSKTSNFPTMASIDKHVCQNLSKAHLLYAQEIYLARVKQYESSLKGKSKNTIEGNRR